MNNELEEKWSYKFNSLPKADIKNVSNCGNELLVLTKDEFIIFSFTNEENLCKPIFFLHSIPPPTTTPTPPPTTTPTPTPSPSSENGIRESTKEIFVDIISVVISGSILYYLKERRTPKPKFNVSGKYVIEDRELPEIIVKVQNIGHSANQISYNITIPKKILIFIDMLNTYLNQIIINI